MLPPLRRAAEMYASKLHLAQMFKPKRLDKLLPGLGKSWAVKTGLNVLCAEHVSNAREWEILSLGFGFEGDFRLVHTT